MRARLPWRWAGLVVLGIGVASFGSRGPALPPEAAVDQQIRTFVECLETGNVLGALRVLGPGFTWDGHGRGDVARTLTGLSRRVDQLGIYLFRVEPRLEASGRRVVVRVWLSASVRAGGCTRVVGDRDPVPLVVSFERFGRHWLARYAWSTGQLDVLTQ
ncbi:MAG: hypothetical protein IT204_17740 [Fimbriimonadaceae bacterium]|nr:hypothetical protein [Fimbriimonadaceae bacterium]